MGGRDFTCSSANHFGYLGLFETTIVGSALRTAFLPNPKNGPHGGLRFSICEPDSTYPNASAPHAKAATTTIVSQTSPSHHGIKTASGTSLKWNGTKTL